MGISETNMIRSDEQDNNNLITIRNNFEHYKVFDAPDQFSRGSGVSLLIKNELTPFIQKYKSYKGHILYINFFFKGKNKLRIIQIYIPANTTNKEGRIDIWVLF